MALAEAISAASAAVHGTGVAHGTEAAELFLHSGE
jgi:hypothetical protein